MGGSGEPQGEAFQFSIKPFLQPQLILTESSPPEMISQGPVTKRHQSSTVLMSVYQQWEQGTQLEILPSNSELLEFFESGREDSIFLPPPRRITFYLTASTVQAQHNHY